MTGMISFKSLTEILSCPELFLLFRRFSVFSTDSSVTFANIKFSFIGRPKNDSKDTFEGGILAAKLLPIVAK